VTPSGSMPLCEHASLLPPTCLHSILRALGNSHGYALRYTNADFHTKKGGNPILLAITNYTFTRTVPEGCEMSPCNARRCPLFKVYGGSYTATNDTLRTATSPKRHLERHGWLSATNLNSITTRRWDGTRITNNRTCAITRSGIGIWRNNRREAPKCHWQCTRSGHLDCSRLSM